MICDFLLIRCVFPSLKAERIPIPDPLVIITGRGKHSGRPNQQGVLRGALENFVRGHLGLDLLSSTIGSGVLFREESDGERGSFGGVLTAVPAAEQKLVNPGRIVLTQTSVKVSALLLPVHCRSVK